MNFVVYSKRLCPYCSKIEQVLSHLSETKGKAGYDYTYDSVYYGQISLRYGLMWELYTGKVENNAKLKQVLQTLSIQTARHYFTEIV